MNSFGRIFRISIFGESHGEQVGVVIDGTPPGIPINLSDFEEDLSRRKSGMRGTTSRIEEDKPKIISGVFSGFSTGAPITIVFENTNQKSSDYSFVKKIPRPGHADFTAMKKFKGFNDYRGGGHFSGRLTLGLVVAGVIAKKIITPMLINSFLIEAGGSPDIDNAVNDALKNNDSIGGIIECRVSNIPSGLGEPFFDSVESMISHLVFSVPSVKGIEFGNGFQASRLTGSQNNDSIVNSFGETSSNNSGGVNGGITNGNNLNFKVAIKPTASISKLQKTFDFEKNGEGELNISGRHDVCHALRVPVIIEACAAIVLSDFLLLTPEAEMDEL
ncbi:MAG: chorismate synthase [Candidatus Delongbacteria bacterium]|nr:chorismate synthase [Candidatus Delongbacteria bacterium]MBN2835332.1 chorismate synthase [Candidatus Delongbacteria bacterium]